jgi:hypothetical protein
MESYKALHPMTPADWKQDDKWLTNRALFLFSLQSNKNKMFYGGGARTPEEAINNLPSSFNLELDTIQKAYPALCDKAYDICFDDFGSKAISYLK